MGASLSSFLRTSKDEELPRGGAEGPSTSGRSEYYSARCEAMLRTKSQFADDIAQEVEFSKTHWSEVRRREVAPRSAAEEELNRDNREVFQQLREKHGSFFVDRVPLKSPSGPVDLGRMVAKGGQAEIYEVVDEPDYLVKVFRRGTSLRELQHSWPIPVLNDEVNQCILWAVMLEDGRFAFLMKRYWGDLRKLLDQAMQANNVDGLQGPPFPFKRNGRSQNPTHLLWNIAYRMRELHSEGVVHRDLKASNILLLDPSLQLHAVVADFECSIGVLGTGYWRAPEILVAIENRAVDAITHEQWEKADVYSYGMTCFEIVTGRIPFDGEIENSRATRQLVIAGRRPELPSDLDDGVKSLIIKCWDGNPLLRPSFVEILEIVKVILQTAQVLSLRNTGQG